MRNSTFITLYSSISLIAFDAYTNHCSNWRCVENFALSINYLEKKIKKKIKEGYYQILIVHKIYA